MAIRRITLERRLPDGQTVIAAVCVRLVTSQILSVESFSTSSVEVASKTSQPCTACCAIIEAFSAADRDEEHFANFLRDDDHAQCVTHKRFFEDIIANSSSKKNPEPSGTIYLVKHKQSLLCLAPFETIHTTDTRGIPESIVMVQTEHKGKQIGIGRIVDENWIDIERIRQWRDICEMSHGNKCSKANLPIGKLSPPWLIDTFDQCLRRGPSGARYVALSYVWGSSGSTATTRNQNIEALQQKGSLGEKCPFELPQTIRDTIRLCGKLTERYLWVDALCIVEDDWEDRQKMIANMSSVYAGAAFTIFAASGESADHGLRGVPGGIPRRFVTPFKGPFDKLFFMQPAASISETKWNTRGWTFQEYVFAPRRLIFIGETVRWECQQACCWEEVAQPGRPISDSSYDRFDGDGKQVFYDRDFSALRTASSALVELYPSLENLQYLVSSYNQRDLSFSKDAIPAFAGTLTAMSNIFPHGFVWGIPVMFFDIALLWRSTTGEYHEGLQRRVPTESVPPTWTWASYQGEISKDFWENSEYVCGSSEPQYWTVPIVDWHILSQSRTESAPISNLNIWHHFRREFFGQSRGLPPGWTFVRRDEAIIDHGQLSQSSHNVTSLRGFYKHENLGDTAFWYPIPLIMEPSLPTSLPSTGRYLFGKVEQARLMICKIHMITPGSDHNFKIDLALTTDARDSICRITPDEGYRSERTGEWVHVVAISGRYTPSCPPVDAAENIEVFNVLWIEWVDGVAYRRGVGQSHVDKWKSLARQTVDLILG